MRSLFQVANFYKILINQLMNFYFRGMESERDLPLGDRLSESLQLMPTTVCSSRKVEFRGSGTHIEVLYYEIGRSSLLR